MHTRTSRLHVTAHIVVHIVVLCGPTQTERHPHHSNFLQYGSFAGLHCPWRRSAIRVNGVYEVHLSLVLSTQVQSPNLQACFEAHSGCGVELRCAKSRKAKLYIFLWQLFTLTGSFLQKHTALDNTDLNCLKRDLSKNHPSPW